jgi:hypothetical protein
VDFQIRITEAALADFEQILAYSWATFPATAERFGAAKSFPTPAVRWTVGKQFPLMFFPPAFDRLFESRRL